MVQRKKRSRITTRKAPVPNSESEILKSNNIDSSITEKMSENSSKSETMKIAYSTNVKEKESPSIRKSIVSTDNPKQVIDQSTIKASDQFGLEGLSGMKRPK